MNKMVKLLLACTGILLFPAAGAAPKEHTLRNDKLQVSIDDRGRLTSIRNLETGRDYAGGDYLWRLYYDTQKEVLRTLIHGSGLTLAIRCYACSLRTYC